MTDTETTDEMNAKVMDKMVDKMNVKAADETADEMNTKATDEMVGVIDDEANGKMNDPEGVAHANDKTDDGSVASMSAKQNPRVCLLV